ncbi:MAG: MFS transporter [Deltaproteobacteria bacterium]|nr:MAG: MFS transporter [Deltaproteobacteria bacterium]
MSEPKWYRGLTPYQWRVLVCACLGWCLDIMDGFLYAIVLFPAMSELLATKESAVIGWYGGIVLSIFMIGWALGGILFGPIADRYGRVKTMALTILIYAFFTGLSGLAQSWVGLAFYRFMTGLGIGGEWATGAALIAESWPEKSRAKAAGIMQASGGIGFFFASLLYLWLGPHGWRWVFAAGVLPAFVAFYIRKSLSEPDRWVKARESRNPFPILFTAPVRRDLFVGTGLTMVATFCYQGAVQWVPTWITSMLHAQGIEEVTTQVSVVTTVLNAGGIVGCLCFPVLADRWGRKSALIIYFLGGFLSMPTTFFLIEEFVQVVLVSPIMGFFGGGIFTGFAIYFPELFPTAIRATAQGFCYNFARFFSAVAPLMTGFLVSAYGSFTPAITTVGLIYSLGLLILIFARETKGQALPD